MLRVFATGSLLKISEKLNEVVATARNMCNALTHCLDLLSQQEEVSWIWKNFISWIIDFLSHEALRKLYFHWPLNTHLVRNEISFIFIFLLFFPFSKTSLLTPSVSVSIAFVTKSLSILLGIFVLRTTRSEGKQSEKANVTLVILAFVITISISADVLCIIQKHASRKPCAGSTKKCFSLQILFRVCFSGARS